jgi:hypothetical protein
MNGEYVKIWNKVVMAYLKAIHRNLPGETKKNHKKLVRIASSLTEN